PCCIYLSIYFSTLPEILLPGNGHTSVLLSCTYPSLSYLRTPLLYIPITVIPPYSSPVHTHHHCHTSTLLSCTYPSLSYLRTPLLYIPITVIPPYSLLYIPITVIPHHCHTPPVIPTPLLYIPIT
ncbi:unnamed protein product, partial [Staurois parvus]